MDHQGRKKDQRGKPPPANDDAERRMGFRILLVEQGVTLLKTLLWVFCVCYVAHELFSMLSDVAQAKEGTVRALAVLVESLSVDRWAMLIGDVVCGVGWACSRSRNKRLTKKLGDYRHAREANDPVNTRSGLDEFGRLREDPK